MSQNNYNSAEDDRFSGIVQTPQVTAQLLEDDGIIPNNQTLPLLLYQAALNLPGENAAAMVESLFRANDWGGSWRNGIYSFHHYHSTAHEVLTVCRGMAKVQLGGEHGPIFSVKPGDVILIPAGVGHKNLGADSDFLVVGAYPPGQNWDMNYGQAGERPAADQNIPSVPLPQTDPVFGSRGPLIDHWHQQD
jgi:uncharacterized protein YjlB